jgi:Tol biopolymer transport system component
MSWSPDGKWLAYADTENDKPGDRAFLLNMETLESHEFPHDPSCRHEGLLTFSHAGKDLLVLCVHHTVGFEYFVTDVEGKSKRSLTVLQDLPTSAIWGGDDKSIIAAVGTPTGGQFDEIRVSDGQVHKLPGTGGDWPTISRDGHKLAFSVFDSHVNIRRGNLRGNETPAVEMFPSTRSQDNSQYSPDGKHVVFDSARSGTWSIWLADSDGGNLVQISQGGPAGYPRWSPDSRKIAFVMGEPNGRLGIYTADISDRVAHKLKTKVLEMNTPYWSHDGKWIYFLGYEGNSHQLYRCPVEGGDATLLVDAMEITVPIESPDGKVLYFPSRFGDANMMMLALDRAGAAAQPVPQMPKIRDQSQWAVTTDGIYFTPQDNPRSISFYDFTSKKMREIFKMDKDLGNGMSISQDGRYMLYSQVDESSASIMLVDHFRDTSEMK